LIDDQNHKNSVRAFGNGLQQAQIGIETSFTVDARGVLNRNDDVKVVVTSKINKSNNSSLSFLNLLGPSKHTCHMQIINNRNSTWTVSYIPTEVGETYIDIFFGDELVNGSPFKVNTFDINQIHVSNIDSGIVGHLVKFHIDASKAGVGQLEIIVQDGLIPCNAIPQDSFRFDATFLPNKPGRHAIDIKFNGLPVPGNQITKRKQICFISISGSPFSCYISDLSRITVSDSLTSAHVGVPLSFDIHHWDLFDYYNQSIPFDITITGKMIRFLQRFSSLSFCVFI